MRILLSENCKVHKYLTFCMRIKPSQKETWLNLWKFCWNIEELFIRMRFLWPMINIPLIRVPL
uniref:Uncharacterized protein n=1 Tax=Rhizophora mucronata TaxID=61149 RepID=A0A2P2QRU7_RHIMU